MSILDWKKPRKIIGSSLDEVRAYVTNNHGHLHCFELRKALIDCMTPKTIEACIADLMEAKLFRMPFPAQYLKFDANIDMKNKKEEFRITLTAMVFDTLEDPDDGSINYKIPPIPKAIMYRPDNGFECEIEIETGRCTPTSRSSFQTDPVTIGANFGSLIRSHLFLGQAGLVIALATRNTLKHTSTNNRIDTTKKIKPRYMGANGAIYLSVTSLDLPPSSSLENDPDHPPQVGTSPRPHLRRGHIHTYAVGEGRSERIRKWIAPMFVNADSNFVSEARRYVVKNT